MLEGVMTPVVSTKVTFEGTLLNQDTRSMVEQSNVGITRSTVDAALVLDYEDMFTGKRSKLSRSQCLCLGRIEIPKVGRFPSVLAPQIRPIGDFEGECVMSTSGPPMSFLRTTTSGHAVVELTSSHIDSPPWRVSNQNLSNNDDGTDVIDFRAEGISVNDLKHVGWRTFPLESTEVLMYILAISESTLQSESNRLRSHKARRRVDNDRFEDLVSAADLASMGSLEVIMDQREVLEERDVEVVLVDVRRCRQKPVVDRVRVEQVTRRRVVGLDLLPIISVDIPPELDRLTPTLSTFVSGFEGGHEVFRGTHASNQIGGVHERKEVDALLTGRVKGSNSSDFLIEVVVSESSRCSASTSKNCRPIRALNRGKGFSRPIPCSKRDLHRNRTIPHEPIHSRMGVGTRLCEARALSSIVFCMDRGRGTIQLAEFRVHAGWGPPSLGRFGNRPAGQGSLEQFQARSGS